MKSRRFYFLTSTTIFVLSLVLLNFVSVHRALAARSIIFPVIGPSSFSNDYDAIHNGVPHHAIDILAAKGQKLVSAIDGTITRVNYPEPSWGYSVSIRDIDGYEYNYLHINDDNPGTNDGKGGAMHAYAPDMKVGNPIVKGQIIGWVGDSGNSNGVSHLHFEMEDPSHNTVNPYTSLLQAKKISAPSPYPQLPNEILPYGQNFVAGVSIAMGNFDLDTAPELVTGAGKGGGPLVKIYDDNGTLIRSFYAYKPDFSGGVDVATGDVDGDGIDEIITGAGPGGGPHVKVFKLDGTEIKSFFAYDPTFAGGVNVAGGDIDGVLGDEIVTGPGPGGGPHVKAFKMNSTEVSSFMAYGADYTGGVDVAAGDVAGGLSDEIVTGTGPGARTQVRVLDKDGNGLFDIGAYPGYTSGVRVAVGNVRTGTLKSEILTIPAAKAAPYVKIWAGDGTVLDGNQFIEKWWSGYYDIAAGYGLSKAATGVNRRASVRFGIQ